MKWYTGSIPEAVAHAQSKKALFCVAILGPDDDSSALLNALEAEDVQSLILNENIVPIRVDADSEEFRQFRAIYTSASSPSVYCITTGGAVVQHINGRIDPTELKSRFERALNLHRDAIQLTIANQSRSSSEVNPAPGTNTSVRTSNPVEETRVNSADPPEQFSSSSPDAVEETGIGSSGQVISHVTSTTDTVETSQQLSLEERIERAKQLALAKQQKKREEDAEEAKRREAERREAGRKVAELKRWQEEQETKRIAEERRKDKKEEAALRQRLREQIAQDRIDREARANPNRETNLSPAGTTQSMTPNTRAAASGSSTSVSNSSYTGLARLQFRLPDGTSHSHAFQPDSTLADIRSYLLSNVDVPSRGFSIWTAFPRRELSTADNGTSLRDLGLIPSAALLILSAPETGIGLAGVRAGTGGIFSFLSVVFLALMSPLTYIWSFVWPGPSDSPAAEPEPSTSRRAPPPRRGGNVLGGSTAGTDVDESLRNRRPAGTGTAENEGRSGESFGRQDGNIRRLRTTNSDSDDELGTYNGNSTQQIFYGQDATTEEGGIDSF